ncbi:hypothetical protein GCM10007907_15280 [Chitinimonas prasina]|uniref:Uncharacterized protein n=1 Tax=Chitinimonas prasina TaxID=1434937 RepID=A0ABQ5YFG0_9NEIS|nr:hypothetical protein GCM10007907_15280 [Chitinimonas prasina]
MLAIEGFLGQWAAEAQLQAIGLGLASQDEQQAEWGKVFHVDGLVCIGCVVLGITLEQAASAALCDRNAVLHLSASTWRPRTGYADSAFMRPSAAESG